ncbi:DNA-3-methyladenine glycosylase I [Spiroplasma tabanidicola]|uniref:DNA-3-methyladenine glycosidase I n=1 Tax=Spiroplasma tabanidicola TaxID=324079 RepID=A0A6I6CEA2_9MOLU|nr:DNA-3-methyladenine glycosylase I [Spiroplasma tabanidicola]QGS52304.1 DNA-3-methyladenine glycosidase I [Spiroplasma tabanidicola]
MKRCNWANINELMKNYHDNEWAKPIYEDKIFFEFLILESMQAGLSWDIVLKKRENFRVAFDNFDYQKIASYGKNKIDELMKNKGIIRNQLKIKAAINNAKQFIEIIKQYNSFSKYIWSFVNNKPIINELKSDKDILSSSLLSDKISNELKKCGFKFVGTTIIYSFLQATGIINDHINDCFVKNKY